MKHLSYRRYSNISLMIHWLSALLIIVLFVMGKIMEEMKNPEKLPLVKIHIIMGFSVLLLTIFRLYLLSKDNIAPLITNNTLKNKLIQYVKNGLYALIITACISGIVSMYWGGYEEAILLNNSSLIVKEGVYSLKIHGFATFLIMVLLVFHIVGVANFYLLKKK